VATTQKGDVMFKKLGFGLLGSFAAASAFASAPTYDVGDAVDAITGGNTAIAALGVAALVMVVGLKVWKRLRGAA
jgi:hypothetical protein